MERPRPILIRAYLRNDQERQLVESVMAELDDQRARFYAGSAEGWVTRDGLERLMKQHIIVDSIASEQLCESLRNPTAAVDGLGADYERRGMGITDQGKSLKAVARRAIDSALEFDHAAPSLPIREIPGVLKRDVHRVAKLPSATIKYLERQSKTYTQEKSRRSRPSGLGAVDDDSPQPHDEMYEVAVQLPMNAQWQNSLAHIAHGICSFEPPNIFRVFLSLDELEKVRHLDFVVSAELYGLEKTISPSLLSAIGLPSPVNESAGENTSISPPTTPPQAKVFEAVLHRASDHEKAKLAIEEFGGTMIADSPTVLRFEASFDLGAAAALAKRPEIKCLAPYQPPKLFSSRARLLAGVDAINAPSDNAAPKNWNGDGELVAVFDSGIDRTHPDLNDRVQDAIAFSLGSQSGTVDDLIGHGTHVAGIIAGTGAASNGAIRGVAPGSKLLSIGMVHEGALLTPPDLGDLLKEATSRGAKIINLSWGRPLGGSYDQGALQLDKFIYDNPEVFVVIAAGNEGRAPEGIHQFNTIGTPASAKNAITVGACGSGHPIDMNYQSFFGLDRFAAPVGLMFMRDPEIPAALGSRGPTDYDGVKPDVSACGIYVLAPRAVHGTMVWPPTFTEHNGRYVYLGGTSMAAPVVSGLAAILRQYLRVERGVVAPSAALLKAILVASAERHHALTADEGGPFEDRVGYPDFHQGFGRVDLSRVLPHPGAPAGRKLLFAEVANHSGDALHSHSLASDLVSDQRSYRVNVPADTQVPLRIVLTWTDFPGNSVQNNLNVYVDGPNNSLHVGNGNFNFQRDPIFENSNLSGIPFDKRNTVEHIKIDNPPAGLYTIRVVAQSTPMARQGYALCVSGVVNENSL